MAQLIRAAVLLTWLAVTCYVLVMFLGALTIGASMAGSIVAALAGMVVFAAISFGWWKVTVWVAVKLRVRDTG